MSGLYTPWGWRVNEKQVETIKTIKRAEPGHNQEVKQKTKAKSNLYKYYRKWNHCSSSEIHWWDKIQNEQWNYAAFPLLKTSISIQKTGPGVEVTRKNRDWPLILAGTDQSGGEERKKEKASLSLQCGYQRQREIQVNTTLIWSMQLNSHAVLNMLLYWINHLSHRDKGYFHPLKFRRGFNLIRCRKCKV